MIFGMPLLGFLFVVVAAPLFEELIFRFGIFRTFTFKNKKLEIIGFIVAMFLFGAIHMVATFESVFATATPNWDLLKSDLLTLPVYLCGGFCLTLAYFKSKNLITSMLAHMTLNLISFIAIFLTRFLEIMRPEVTSNIINLFNIFG